MDPNPYEAPKEASGRAGVKNKGGPTILDGITIGMLLALFIAAGFAGMYVAWAYYIADSISRGIGP